MSLGVVAGLNMWGLHSISDRLRMRAKHAVSRVISLRSGTRLRIGSAPTILSSRKPFGSAGNPWQLHLRDTMTPDQAYYGPDRHDSTRPLH
jgi:hypothetical protein